MNYALDQFTMRDGEVLIVQGANSLYTYQNTGNSSALIQGSNDTVHWTDITQIAVGTSSVKEHSYKYLRSLGNTTVAVNRGSIISVNNNSGNGSGTGTGSSFTVEGLDLSINAITTPAEMKLIHGTENEQELVGTAQIGQINTVAANTINCYFEAQSGIVNFTLEEETHFIFVSVQNEPSEVLTPEIMQYGNPFHLLQLNYQDNTLGLFLAYDISDPNPAQLIIQDIMPIVTVSLKLIDSRTVEVYVNDELKLTHVFSIPFYNYWQTMDMSSQETYLTQLNYNLSQAIGSLQYDLSELNDGTYYEFQHSANLFSKSINQGDFAQFYNNKTGVIVHPQ